MPYVHDITPAPSTGGLTIPHYDTITPLSLDRLMRTTIAHRIGSGATLSLRNANTSSDSYGDLLFALDENRFILFWSDSTPTNLVGVVIEVGVSSVTVVSNNITLHDTVRVVQSPTNPLQFVALSSQERVALVTVAASGTSLTASVHNASGIAGVDFGSLHCDVAWADDGASFVVVHPNSNAGRLGHLLYTVSGTSLTYVSISFASVGSVTSTQSLVVTRTGGANNEYGCVCLRNSGAAHITERFTFTPSAVTEVAISTTTLSFSADVDSYFITRAGFQVWYAAGATSNNRVIADTSGSGTLILAAGSSGAAASYVPTSEPIPLAGSAISPIGPYMKMYGRRDSIGGSYGHYVSIQGLGGGFDSRNVLYNSSTYQTVGAAVSVDFTKLLYIARNSGTFAFEAFAIPTS